MPKGLQRAPSGVAHVGMELGPVAKEHLRGREGLGGIHR